MRDDYKDKEAERQADIHIEELDARILLICGTGDEAWPSDYSVNYMKQRLEEAEYSKEYKAVVYPNASHLIGMMYKSLNTHREDCMKALEDSERQIIEWIKGGN